MARTYDTKTSSMKIRIISQQKTLQINNKLFEISTKFRPWSIICGMAQLVRFGYLKINCVFLSSWYISKRSNVSICNLIAFKMQIFLQIPESMREGWVPALVQDKISFVNTKYLRLQLVQLDNYQESSDTQMKLNLKEIWLKILKKAKAFELMVSPYRR